MTRKPSVLCIIICISRFFAGAVAAAAERLAKPNIVWIVVDDMSANFSCYGEKTIQTPHVDRLAARGDAVHARPSSPPRSARRAARR